MKKSRNNNYSLGEDFYSFQIEKNKKKSKNISKTFRKSNLQMKMLEKWMKKNEC